MALILNIETATDICSVCLAHDGNLLCIAENKNPKSHASVLTPLIQKVLNKSKIDFHQLDAVAVSKGPGSYTGLRIGVAAAKGICYATGKQLLAINTLKAMTSFFIEENQKKIQNEKENILFVPLIDARRMEVYSAVFDYDLNFVRNTKAEILNENSFSDLSAKKKLYFLGDGTAKLKSFIKAKSNFILTDNFIVSSQGIISLSENAYLNKQFEDIAYFEPFYLKEFLATSAIK